MYNNEITIYRHEAGTYNKGVWTHGFLQRTIRVKASVQPITGRDLMTLPEGEITKVRFKAYFEEPVELTFTDIIKYEDKMYKVISDNDWGDAPFLEHVKVYLALLD